MLVYLGHLTCCKILLEKGGDGLSRMHQGWTPAHCAAEGGHLKILHLLATHSKHYVTTQDDRGDTPEKVAVIYGHVDCVMFLKEL